MMDYGSVIQLLDCSKLVINWKNSSKVINSWHDVIINLFDVFIFFLSSLASSARFMWMSSLFLGLWQSLFIKDLTLNPEIPPSEFSPVSGHWSELAISNLVRMSLMKNKLILQNTRFKALALPDLLKETEQR